MRDSCHLRMNEALDHFFCVSGVLVGMIEEIGNFLYGTNGSLSGNGVTWSFRFWYLVSSLHELVVLVFPLCGIVVSI